MKNIEVSIIIVNYNNFMLLEQCLRSIRENTKEVEHEIIIVDNNSSEVGLCDITDDFPNLT